MKPSQQELAFLKAQIDNVQSQLSDLRSKAASIQQGQAAEAYVAAKTPQARSLEIQLKSQESQLTALRAQYEPMQAELQSMVAKTKASGAAAEKSEADASKQESDLAKMKSLFAKMVEIANNSAKTAGANVTEAMVIADELPPEHLAHTKVLENALKQSDKAAFDLALSKIPDEDINYRDSKGKTLLMYQAANGFPHGVKALIGRGANPDMLDKDGLDALAYACLTPHIDVVTSLAQQTSNVNKQYPALEHNTAMHILLFKTGSVIFSDEFDTGLSDLKQDGSISLHGAWGTFNITGDCTISEIGAAKADGYNTGEDKASRMIDFLVKNCKADLNVQNAYGRTPFFVACEGKLKYVATKILDEHEGSISPDTQDINGFKALAWAIEVRDIPFLERVLKFDLDITQSDTSGKTCLHWSILYRLSDIANWFIRHNPDLVNIPTNDGFYPWHVASMKGSLELMKVFYETMSDIDFKCDGDGNFTALWLASQEGHNDIVEWCISEKADINLSLGNSGRTPLISAIAKRHLEVVKTLYSNSAEIDKPDKDGASPLYYSLGYAGTHEIAITKFLLENGANPNQAMDNGDTPMHVAAYNANTVAIKFLLDFGAEINVINQVGKSPLFYLIENDNLHEECKLQAIQYLLLKGAKYDVQDTKGNSLASMFDQHFPAAKEFAEQPDKLPDLAEFEQTIIGEV